MAAKKGKSESSAPAVETASFFHKLQPIKTFMHMKAPKRDKKSKKRLTLLFRMALNGNNVRSAPTFIQTAYTEVAENSASSVALDKVLGDVDMQIFDSDKIKKSACDLSQCELQSLVVKEIKSSKGDQSIVLTFEVEYPYEPSLWRYLGNAYATDVYLKFDAEQASLLDLADNAKADDEDDDQGSLALPDNVPPAPSGKDAAAGDTATE